MLKTFTLSLLLSVIAVAAYAQQPLSAEDSLTRNLSSSATTVGGYGNAFYQNNSHLQSAKVNLERGVIFIGHKFNDKISVFSELELEDAKLASGESGGEISFEQLYLKFNLNANQYLVAGLYTPRIGIINENHLPNTFNGNERNYVETLVIPATWRELGVSFYGNLTSVPLTYSVGLVNGLDAGGFAHGTGLRGGQFEGRNASANSLAVTAAVQYFYKDFKFQVSGYYGGAAAVSKRKADSLGLNSGIFGTPVAVGEADVQWAANGFQVRALGTAVSIPDAEKINHAYANNTPKTEYGAYLEVGYDLLSHVKTQHNQQLVVFVRDEKFNLNAQIPSSGVTDGTLNQNDVVAGFTYLPIRNVAVKADVRFIHTGDQNAALIVNPNPVALPYQTDYNLVNLGVAFSF